MTHFTHSCFLAIVLSLLAGLMPHSSSAQDQIVSGENVVVASDKLSNRIDLEFGYFSCRRESFKDIYGSCFDYGLNFEHRMTRRWSWSLRTEFMWLHEEESKVKYWSLSETPMLICTLSDESGLASLIGAGIGLTLRNVMASLAQVGENYDDLDDLTATQRELSAVLVGMAGVDIHLSRSIVMGGRFHFDYHPFGDPSVGEFGDTGGYHFTFRLGHKF